jgi:hypothetical protein
VFNSELHYTIFNDESQSVGHLLDFHWCLPCYFQWTVAADLLIVHRSSNGKVQWTERSDQKWMDKQRKLSGKLLGLQSQKNSVLDTLSPMESTWSLLGKAVAV